ncbi:sarcosine oxidase subunit gamma [Kushneria pakistanensis]|uniref:Sarcosine oxidase subunit gamma n=1 Tax=Kushneria pakistanensis TaxID=1508770 RepID=A0ABQ3FJC0_9GAMM|nr:sarcosine oxidase subunit gamma family protein [Kushneria pakistanensis]GHC25532.1 sarcosine oxidase subunit gamma [Kushneria pakistanensis]
MSDVKEFETRPADTSRAESPLTWSLHEQKSLPHASNPGIILSEKPFLGHLVVRGGAIVLDEAVREVMDMALPAKPHALVSDDSGERTIQWLSPDEWLIIVPGGEEFALEQKLRQSLGQSHFSIVNVSGGQTVLSLKGKWAREVLMKSISYDVHPQAFPVGKGVSTVFAKATVILRRAEEDGWELVIRRSFADYCYRWLLDASSEYGVSVTR